jgi:hypothetical protein
MLVSLCSNREVMARILTGHVLGVAELHKGPQTDDADKGDEEADGKHHDDLDLLSERHGQAEELRKRQGDDGQIKEDVDSGSRPAQDVDADALGLELAVPPAPSPSYRVALEGQQEIEDDDVAGVGEDERVDDVAELSSREDLQVEAENRDLGE